MPIIEYCFGQCNSVIFQGIRTSIAKETYSFVIIQGGVPVPTSPSGSAYANKFDIERCKL